MNIKVENIENTNYEFSSINIKIDDNSTIDIIVNQIDALVEKYSSINSGDISIFKNAKNIVLRNQLLYIIDCAEKILNNKDNSPIDIINLFDNINIINDFNKNYCKLEYLYFSDNNVNLYKYTKLNKSDALDTGLDGKLKLNTIENITSLKKLVNCLDYNITLQELDYISNQFIDFYTNEILDEETYTDLLSYSNKMCYSLFAALSNINFDSYSCLFYKDKPDYKSDNECILDKVEKNLLLTIYKISSKALPISLIVGPDDNEFLIKLYQNGYIKYNIFTDLNKNNITDKDIIINIESNVNNKINLLSFNGDEIDDNKLNIYKIISRI
jgi:hypothetical protein